MTAAIPLEAAGFLAILEDDATSVIEKFELLEENPSLCRGGLEELIGTAIMARNYSMAEADLRVMSKRYSQRDQRRMFGGQALNLLQRCSEVGIDQAFAERFPPAQALT